VAICALLEEGILRHRAVAITGKFLLHQSIPSEKDFYSKEKTLLATNRHKTA
jgi:hypothetical protein